MVLLSIARLQYAVHHLVDLLCRYPFCDSKPAPLLCLENAVRRVHQAKRFCVPWLCPFRREHCTCRILIPEHILPHLPYTVLGSSDQAVHSNISFDCDPMSISTARYDLLR